MAYLRIKKLKEEARIPEMKSTYAAGFDLFAIEDRLVKKKSRRLVKTGISMEIPTFAYGRIASRSGLALKKGIEVGAGVIDPDYRGEIKVLLFNHGNTDVLIKKGSGIAQIIIETILRPAILEVENLTATKRAGKGFGSTNEKIYLWSNPGNTKEENEILDEFRDGLKNLKVQSEDEDSEIETDVDMDSDKENKPPQTPITAKEQPFFTE